MVKNHIINVPIDRKRIVGNVLFEMLPEILHNVKIR